MKDCSLERGWISKAYFVGLAILETIPLIPAFSVEDVERGWLVLNSC
jgi:hypothetical protein